MESVGAPTLYRCRSCRQPLFTTEETGALETLSCCRGARQLRGLPEERLPGWVHRQLEDAGWTRGRLLCPARGCTAKLGAFDFISGATCDCRGAALPAVRLARCRFDELPAVAPLGSAAAGTVPAPRQTAEDTGT